MKRITNIAFLLAGFAADLVIVPGARHGDMACWGPDVREAVRGFFRQWLSRDTMPANDAGS